MILKIYISLLYAIIVFYNSILYSKTSMREKVFMGFGITVEYKQSSSPGYFPVDCRNKICLLEREVWICSISKSQTTWQTNKILKIMSLLPTSLGNGLGKQENGLNKRGRERERHQREIPVTSCKLLYRDLLVHEITHDTEF